MASMSQTSQANQREITPILKFRPRHPNPRRIAWYAAALSPAVLAKFCALSSDARPDIVMLCGPAARLTRAHVRAAEAAGWRVTDYRSKLGSATFHQDGYHLDVRGSVVWFGVESDPDRIRTAWYRLAAALRAAFGPDAYLWPTPTLTGQELMRSALPLDCEYPVIYPEIMQTLASMGQGRVELFTAPGGVNASLERTPGAVLLDQRWAYAHHLHNLPTGAVAHEIFPEPGVLLCDAKADVGYAPSFYRFRATVPADWRHIGLLPMRPAEGGRLVFPHQPGRTFDGWASGAEIFLALNQGWRVLALEKISWPWGGRNDPAGKFIRRMVALRDEHDAKATRGDLHAGLVARAARAIVLGLAGSWNRVRDVEEGFTPYSDPGALPPGAVPLPAIDADGWEWKRTLPRVTEWSHPEWAQTVYGRTRADAAKFLLTLPPEWLLGFRTDGAWLTDDPRIADSGRPGGWRVKATYAPAGGIAVPQTEAEMLALIHAAMDGENQGEGEADGAE